MTPSEALASHRAFINEVGETVSIRRFTGGSGASRTYTDTATTARVIDTGSDTLVSTNRQRKYKLIALVDTLSAILPVTVDDRVVLSDGKVLSILNADDRTR